MKNIVFSVLITVWLYMLFYEELVHMYGSLMGLAIIYGTYFGLLYILENK